MTKKTSKNRGEAFYRRLVAAYRRSGLSQRAFAAERGIPAGTLSHWCHKLKKLDSARGEERPSPSTPAKRRRARKSPPSPAAPPQPSFVPVRVVEPRPARAPAPAPLGLTYELVLGRGVLRLPADFDPIRVGALLRAAEVVC